MKISSWDLIGKFPLQILESFGTLIISSEKLYEFLEIPQKPLARNLSESLVIFSK